MHAFSNDIKIYAFSNDIKLLVLPLFFIWENEYGCTDATCCLHKLFLGMIATKL